MTEEPTKQELGKVERPEAERFRGKRIVYLVPLVFSPTSPPAELARILDRYWAGAEDHVARLEERVGQVKHVFIEMVDRPGEEGLRIADKISAGAAKIASSRVQRGATLEALEDTETLTETMDWERCLMIGLTSRKVAEQVSQAYQDAGRRRYELMARRFEDTLKEGEAGLAFLGEHHRVQFPEGIQVFYVAPPALNDLHRWLRDFRERSAESPTTQPEEPPEKAEEPRPADGTPPHEQGDKPEGDV